LNPAALAAAATTGNAAAVAASQQAGSGCGGGAGNGPGGSPGSIDGSGLRRPRSVYSSQQIGQLETYFRVNEYIDGERKRQLSQLTNIPEHQIKVWFQNRRQKKKREIESVEQQQSSPLSTSSFGQQHHPLFPSQPPPAGPLTGSSAQNIGSIDPGDLSS
jgi:hypothetical protein